MVAESGVVDMALSGYEPACPGTAHAATQTFSMIHEGWPDHVDSRHSNGVRGSLRILPTHSNTIS